MPNGDAYTTTASLAQALGVNERMLKNNYRRNPEDFSPTNLSMMLKGPAGTPTGVELDYFRANRSMLNIKRVKEDLVLWPEEDMYVHCTYCKSKQARIFAKKMALDMKERHRLYGFNEIDGHPTVIKLQQEIEQLKSISRESASKAGSSLRLHRRPTNWVN
jgi:hypothetical protein